MKYLVFFIALIFATACVSKKQHFATVQRYNEMADSLAYQLDSTRQIVYSLRLDTAERRGENTALLSSQKNLLDRIIELDDEIERLQQQSASQVENLDERLQQKDALIAKREATIEAARALLEARSGGLTELSSQLRDTLWAIDSSAFTVELGNGQLALSIQSDFLFYRGSTSKTHRAGREALAQTAKLLLPYTGLEVIIIGHTSSAPLRRRSIDTKWLFTAMRAATLADLMTSEMELSTSRVMAAGKGDFAPRASNATEEGRALNDRIELRIRPSEERLRRDLRRVLRNGP
ncbi:MAG: OmpA family protein [Bacteroidetes bacterium]|jgi:chemotaxis protein MotB|nr:OmpA family protein [Bacteroidota bacterium]